MSPRRRALISLLFLLSGATGLAYEVLWAKYLGFMLGHSSHAHAIVLATFLGGLAIGNAAIGRRADKAQNPLMLYAWLELGIGLFAGLSPLLLSVLHEAFISGAGRLHLGSAQIGVLRLAVAAIALLPPTILMGGTLPVLGRLLTERLDRLKAAISWLYFLNSAGAAVGCLLTGFALIPTLGLNRTTSIFAFLNVAIGLIALGVSKGSPDPLEPPESHEPFPEVPAYAPPQVRVILVAAFVSGFVSLAYEVGWIRLLTLVLGSSTYSFALMLGAFIAGIALGSLIVNRRGLPGDDALGQFGAAQLGVALSIMLTLPAYQYLPYLFLRTTRHFPPSTAGFYAFETASFGICIALMLIPTTFIGMTLPLAVRIATRAIGEVGTSVGRVFSLNTLGNVLGSLAAGLWLLPLLGIRGLIEAGVVVNLLLAVLVTLSVPGWSVRRRAAWVAVPLLVIAGLRVMTPPWDLAQITSGAFRMRGLKGVGETYDAFRRSVTDERILFNRDDAYGTVTVSESDGQTRLRVNGKVDASTRGDLATQLLLGHLPLLLHPDPRRVLIVGLGSGITAGAVLTHPVGALDLIEISPAVVAANKHFTAYNRRPLEDTRLRLQVDDAMSVLQIAPDRYDVIIAEPSNPWIAGVGNLFTTEYYQRCRARLAPGGLILQWLHAYEMDDETFKLMLRTMADSVPHVSVWQAGRRDLMIVGSFDNPAIDFAKLASALGQPAVAEDLARIGLGGVADVLALQLAGDRKTRAIAGDGPLNSLRNPLLEYRAPIAFFSDSLSDAVFDADERLSPATRATVRDIYLLAFLQSRGFGLTRDEFDRVATFLEWHARNPKAALVFGRAWARAFPADTRAWQSVARMHAINGESREAAEAANRALALEPRNLRVLELATRLAFNDVLADGDILTPALGVAELEKNLNALLASDPATRQATHHKLAALHLATGRYAEAFRDMDRASSGAEGLRLWVKAAEVATERGEDDWAIRYVRRAQELNPGDARLAAILAAMRRMTTR
jgi:predicted membrane-bound spermidine synthase/tetratricopeptide (TPR) repeat protein